MSNDFYNHNDGVPATLSRGASTTIRSEFDLVQAGFDKLPTVAQIFGNAGSYVVAGGSADNWTATVAAAALTAYTDGMQIRVKFPNANTTSAPVINLNALGTQQIVSEQGGALNAGDIVAGEIATLTYNATFGKFQITLGNSVASAQVSAAAAAASRTASLGDANAAHADRLICDTDATSATANAAAAANSAIAAQALANLRQNTNDGTTGANAVANNLYFSVLVPGSTSSFFIYQNVSGLATLLTTIQTAPFNYYGIGVNGYTQMQPSALNIDPTKLGWYEISPAYMFQDRFGMTPVTAPGQVVGLVLPKNGQNGPLLVAAASSRFTATTGWTGNGAGGWAINTGAGKAVATAATGTLSYAIASGLTTSLHACVDVVVQNYVSGTMQVDVGAGFVNTPITGNGTYRVYTTVGGSPGTGVQLRCPVAFTAEVTLVQVSMASGWAMFAPNDAQRPTYNLDARGLPKLDHSLVDSRMKTDAVFTQTVPSYSCLVLGRTAQNNLTLATFGYINYSDAATGFNVGVGTTLSGQFHNMGARPGTSDFLNPSVLDCYLEAGFTSGYNDAGGTRDVFLEGGLNSNSKRRVPNNFTGAESLASVFFGLNYTGGLGVPNSPLQFYGGCLMIGSLAKGQRRKVLEYFSTLVQYDQLRETEYDLFGFIGQSNMMGVGNQSTSTAVTFGQGAEYIDDGHLKPLKDPTQHAVPANAASSGSLLPACANAWYTAKGRPMLCVGSAASGVGLVNSMSVTYGNWLTGFYARWFGLKFKNAMRDVKCIPRGVFYLGGEQDGTLSITQAAYEALLVSLRDAIRLATGIPNLPLLIISLDDTTGSPAQWAIMRAAMVHVVTVNEGMYLVQPYQNWLGAGHLSDGIHRDQFALNADGAAAGTNAAALDIFNE